MKEGWNAEDLGKLCALVRGPFGGSLKKAIFKPSGYAVYEQQHAINDQFEQFRYFVDEEKFGEMGRFQVAAGDLIMSCSGTMGKVAIVPEDAPEGIINQALLKISPGESLDVNFLRYWMDSPGFQEQLSATTMGVAIKNVASVKTLKAMPIPLPPLEEQQRIVAVLDEAFEGLARARTHVEANLQNARELFGSVLAEVYDSFVQGMPTKALNDICDLIVDCEHKTAPLSDKGFPSIRTPNIGPGYLILEGVNRVSFDTYEKWTRRGKPLPGDLILAREAPAGNVGVIPEGETVCLGQRTVLIRPDEQTNSQFLADFLMHPAVQSRLLAKSTGATVQHINMRDIRGLVVPDFPTTTEQNAAANTVQKLRQETEKLATLRTTELQDLDDLRQSILQKAFAGELT